MKKLFNVVPDILKAYKGGKMANPYLSVDTISGLLLYHYGVRHVDFILQCLVFHVPLVFVLSHCSLGVYKALRVASI